MAINQLSTANTFEQWLTATQYLIEKSNYYESNTEIFYQTVSDTSNLANVVFANAAIVNAQTALVLTTASNVYSTYANVIVYAGYVESNLAAALEYSNNINAISQGAYDTANASLATSQNAANLIYKVFDDTANNTTLYPALFVSNTGTPNTAYVSSTKLYYNPSTGQLSATNFDSLSDINKKTNIETIQNAVDLVMNLRGVTFKWKENGYKSMGLIAQEVEHVIPEVVTTNEFGEKSVTYGSLIGLLVEAIKDLKKDIDQIKILINK